MGGWGEGCVAIFNSCNASGIGILEETVLKKEDLNRFLTYFLKRNSP